MKMLSPRVSFVLLFFLTALALFHCVNAAPPAVPSSVDIGNSLREAAKFVFSSNKGETSKFNPDSVVENALSSVFSTFYLKVNDVLKMCDIDLENLPGDTTAGYKRLSNAVWYMVSGLCLGQAYVFLTNHAAELSNDGFKLLKAMKKEYGVTTTVAITDLIVTLFSVKTQLGTNDPRKLLQNTRRSFDALNSALPLGREQNEFFLLCCIYNAMKHNPIYLALVTELNGTDLWSLNYSELSQKVNSAYASYKSNLPAANTPSENAALKQQVAAQQQQINSLMSNRPPPLSPQSGAAGAGGGRPPLNTNPEDTCNYHTCRSKRLPAHKVKDCSYNPTSPSVIGPCQAPGCGRTGHTTEQHKSPNPENAKKRKAPKRPGGQANALSAASPDPDKDVIGAILQPDDSASIMDE